MQCIHLCLFCKNNNLTDVFLKEMIKCFEFKKSKSQSSGNTFLGTTQRKFGFLLHIKRGKVHILSINFSHKWKVSVFVVIFQTKC